MKKYFGLFLAVLLSEPSFLPAQDSADEAEAHKAYQAYTSGNYALAVKTYADIIARHPDNARAYTARGAAYDLMGDHDKSIEDENHAISLDPTLAMAYVNLASAYGAKGNFAKVVEADNQAIKLDPNNEAAYSDLVNAYTEEGQYDKALESLNQSVKLGSDDCQTLNNAAWFLATCPQDNLRDGARAVQLAQKGCDIDKSNLGCRDTLAVAYAETGNFDRAIQIENELLTLSTIDPDFKSKLESRLTLFKNHKPYRSSPST